MITIIYRKFSTIQMIFGKRFLSGHLIKFFRAFLFPIFEFLLKLLHDAKDSSNPSTYPSWGSDNSPPLKRILSRDSEVVGRKEGYSTRRRSSLSHVASFSEWCDHCSFRNLIF